MPDLVRLLARFVKAIWRTIEVKRKEPAKLHTLAEYADALLFGEHQEESLGQFPRNVPRAQTFPHKTGKLLGRVINRSIQAPGA